MMKRATLAAACAVLSTLSLGALAQHAGHDAHPTAASASAATGVGVVRKVDAAQGKVTLQHEPIKSLGWPGMTMAFRVKDAKMLAALEPGRKVRFSFVQQGSEYVITSIE